MANTGIVSLMKIVTSDQMRLLEQRSESAGVSTDSLMENAGLAVARSVRRRLGRVVGTQVVVVAGKGNNGGDGLVVARRLRSWGGRVTVCLTGPRPPGDPKLALVVSQGSAVVHLDIDAGLAQLRESLASADLVVDAVLGTGRSRPIEGVLEEILRVVAGARARRSGLNVMALDLPTGLDADSGAVDPACLAADATVTLGRPKPGLYAFPGAEYTGQVEIVDIGIPAGLDGDIPLALMTREWAAALLPRRPLSAHKGTFGRTMVVAGSRNYPGAAYLAATAAGRAGAGLVTLAIPESLRTPVAARAAEATYLPLPESSPGMPGEQAAALVLENLDGYSALLVGCGLGQAPETGRLVEGLLLSGAPLPPAVIDADGLNLLPKQGGADWWKRLLSPAVLTPHPGEMAWLTDLSTQAVGEDRIGVAVRSAGSWDKVVVLKGAFTVVACPSGRAMMSPFANPGLASAGTGDVLAGAIAGLLSQGMPLEDAATLGVYLHGLAGDLATAEMGTTGMLAGDLLSTLPKAAKGVGF